MSSASFFSPVISSDLLVSHFHNRLSDRPKKRKRKRQDLETGSDGEASESKKTLHQRETPASLPLTAPTTSPWDPKEPTQDQGTALTLEGKYCQSLMPHGSLRKDLEVKQPGPSTNIDDDIATLRPPLSTARYPGSGVLIADDVNGKVGMRQRNLAAVTAIMHRCILAGDYVRAGRAWGMILRAEINGHSMDLRANGRWGLGAEILLQRDTQLVRRNFEVKEEMRSTELHGNLLGARRFERVKDYYERLILQHPYRKTFVQATSSVDFYVAMFGMWISSVVDQEAQAEQELSLPDGAALQNSPSASGRIRGVPISASQDHHRTVREEVHKEVLRSAEEIAGQLEELTSSPPYSDDAKFARLGNMVNLWKTNLSRVASIAQTDMRHDVDVDD